MRMISSLAALLLATGSASGSSLRSGPCPSGLNRPTSGFGTSSPSGHTVITESKAALHGSSTARPLDCLYGARGEVQAALFAPDLGLPYAEIVVYEAGAYSAPAPGRRLTAPGGIFSFEALPSLMREQIEQLLPKREADEPDWRASFKPRTVTRPAPDTWSLKDAGYNPARPASGAVTEDVRAISRTYDLFDRLETETVPLQGGGTATVRYTYYDNDRRKTVTDAFGRVTFYEYDAINRVSRVTTNQGLSDEQVTIYEYWPDSLVKAIRRPNGVVTTYDYDDADRLKTVEVTKDAVRLVAYAYTYDHNGNRLSQVEENGGPPETTSYGYDDRDRLKTVAYPDDTTVTYGYDAIGNRVAETVRDATNTIVSDKIAVFDAINRLSTVTDSVDPAGSATFTYDGNGNLRTKATAAGTQEHRYDVRDLLVETRDGTSITARFAYDAFGRRYLKIGAEGVRQYLYDQTSVLEELDEDGHEVAKYEYGSTQLASVLRRDEPRRYYHLDGLGSVTTLTDAQGAVVARYHMDAWGNFRFPTELDASKNRFGFTGYLFDTETALYYAKARFYDPSFGRFTTQDSVLGQIDDPPSLHRYFYANANPLRYVDPTGHCTGAVSFSNFSDCFTGALTGIVAPPANFVANWGSALLYNATGSERFHARGEAFQGQKEAVDKALQSPAHLLTATVEGSRNQLDAFSQAINEGRGNQAAQILGGGLAQAPLLAEGGGTLKITPSRALVTSEGALVPAGGAVGLRGSPSVASGLLLSKNANEAEATVVQENTPTKDNPATTRQVDANDASAPAAPKSGTRAGGQIEVLSGSKLEHLNASIGEIHGYENMMERGYAGIRGPGKTTARGADSIAFDMKAQEIVVQDAKYRGPAGSYPSSISPKKMQRWRPEIRRGIEDMPPGPIKDAAMKAFEEGRIRPELFRWPQ